MLANKIPIINELNLIAPLWHLAANETTTFGALFELVTSKHVVHVTTIQNFPLLLPASDMLKTMARINVNVGQSEFLWSNGRYRTKPEVDTSPIKSIPNRATFIRKKQGGTTARGTC